MATDMQVREALAIAADAGFRGLGLVNTVAIAIRESGLNATARCYNYRDANGVARCSPTWRPDVTSVDRGWWQINSVAHPDVSDADADDPRAAARHAYRISGGGTNFKAWVAFTTGAFRDALAQVARVAGVALDELPQIGQRFAYTDPTGGSGGSGGSGTVSPPTAATVPGGGVVRPAAVGVGGGALVAGPFGDLLGGAGDLGGSVLRGLFSPVGDAAENIAGSVLQGVFRLTVIGALLAGGVALVVIGAWRAVAPTRERVTARADEAKNAIVGAATKGAA